jgi:hypothetical protein
MHIQKNKRLLIELERVMREVNRDTINPLFEELSIDDLKPSMEMVAKARGKYLEEFKAISLVAKEGHELTPELVKNLRYSRLIYDELASASKAMDIAIERGYLDVRE